MTTRIEGVARIIAVAFGGVFAGFLVTAMVLELSMRDRRPAGLVDQQPAQRLGQ